MECSECIEYKNHLIRTLATNQELLQTIMSLHAVNTKLMTQHEKLIAQYDSLADINILLTNALEHIQRLDLRSDINNYILPKNYAVGSKGFYFTNNRDKLIYQQAPPSFVLFKITHSPTDQSVAR